MGSRWSSTSYEEMWRDTTRTVDPGAREEKIRRIVKYVYDLAHLVSIYPCLSPYAVSKEVSLFHQKSMNLRIKETSVTKNHWSVRAEGE